MIGTHRLVGSLLVAALALMSAGAAEAVTPGRVEFQVLRSGELSGRHAVEVAPTRDGYTVRVAIDLKGQVLFFPFSYTHRCTETWASGRLTTLSCTDRENDGPVKSVTAKAEGADLQVRGPGFAGALPVGVLPTSWWREDIMRQSRLLDTRTGKLMPVRVRRIGEERLAINGESVMTTRYRLTSSTDTDIWYDAEGRWLRMTFSISGQSFEYRLTSPRSSVPRL